MSNAGYRHPIFTDGNLEKVETLYKGYLNPRTIKCRQALARRLPLARALLDQSIIDNYGLKHFRNDGRQNEEEIEESRVVISAAKGFRELIPGKWPNEPHTLTASDQVQALYIGVVEKFLPVVGSSMHEIWWEPGVYVQTVTVEDVVSEAGPAPLTYFPLDSLQVHTEGH